MNNLYVYGGFVKCSGTLDNGKPWEGFRVLLARCDKSGKAGATASVVKASCTDGIRETLLGLALGKTVEAYFDERGRLVMLVEK